MAEGSDQGQAVYKEPAVREPSIKCLSEISESLGLDLEEAELQAHKKSIASTLRNVYQRLYELPEPKLRVKYPRTPGYRPSADENPYNAWYYRCDIRGAPTGKLQGKTVAIKDTICVAGVPMMNGSVILEGFIPDIDATVVTRILDAGGHIVGKAVCENLCFDGASFTSVTGPVVNPHGKTRMANGSSSGSAALVAGGHVDMALGGDQGGSIRMPAAACGIVGLKPTYGLVPYTGIVPMEFTLDHVGPMARTVYDAALLLEVIAGYDDGLDARQPRDLNVPESYTSKLTGEISGLKIGLLKEAFGLDSSEPDVDALVREAADRLRVKTGAKVEDVSVPMHLDGKAIFSGIATEGATRMTFDGNGFGTCAEMYYDTKLQEAFARGVKSHPNHLPMTVKNTIILGRYLQKEYNGTFYSKSQNLARELCKAYERAFEEYDVLVMPTMPKKAPTFPTANPSFEEYLTKARESNRTTSIFNATGHPALSINAGFSDGLPVGMMIVGRKFEDATVLNVGYAYEKIRDEKI